MSIWVLTRIFGLAPGWYDLRIQALLERSVHPESGEATVDVPGRLEAS